MRYNRFFLLEPNLKKSYGHVIEFPFTIQKYLKKKGKEAYVICNKNIDPLLLSSLPETYPLISQGCFDDLGDDGNSFLEDLKKIDRKFSLRKNDILISLTSYTNQILGIGKFIQQNRKNSPIFCIWFHQLYPPTKIFSETLLTTFQDQTHTKLQIAFNDLSDLDNVFLFTTPSSKLKKAYEQFSRIKVSTLALPYSKLKNNHKKHHKNITLGYLGDGRFEKGLTLILEYLSQTKDSPYFIIENIYPRGYSNGDLLKMQMIEARVKERQSKVTFINKPLSNDDYKKTLANIDIFVLPYHPNSYDKRVSGVFIEAALQGIPIIVPLNTWMAEEIAKYKNGIAFNYKSGARGLELAIRAITSNIDKYKIAALSASKKYNKLHTPDNFVSTLLNAIK